MNRERDPGRQEQCSVCGADLHCCRNCNFYDYGAYNDCHEPQAERVLDKTRSNFCEFFNFKSGATLAEDKIPTAKQKLDLLFKKPS